MAQALHNTLKTTLISLQSQLGDVFLSSKHQDYQAAIAEPSLCALSTQDRAGSPHIRLGISGRCPLCGKSQSSPIYTENLMA